jgi:hypothetical protein
MRCLIARSFAVVLLSVPLNASAHAAEKPVHATVETSLSTASRQIRQFAFDGDPKTYFASDQNPSAADHFTLVFDKPVAVKSIEVHTGKPRGGDALDSGSLEVSADGKKFESIAKFADGKASAKPDSKKIVAVRIKPLEEMKHPLAINEIAIESDPPVANFKYPIEFVVNVTDAPEMKAWAEKAAHICEREYFRINEELRSDGFKPPTAITMTMKNDYKGVAETGGGKIKGSVKYFKDHPDDFGAMVHETVHAVQAYRTRNNPGWLVEGIADYYRFFKFEPGKIGRINPTQARYDGSYRVTAAFLDYVSKKYDKDLVLKLNKAMREGEYNEEIWKSLTKKPLPQLGDEWKATLKR